MQEAPWCRRTASGWELVLRIQPGARKSAVAGLHGGALKVQIQAPPVDGKANAALIRFIADKLEVPARSVAIVSGEHSRDKRLVVSGAAADPRDVLTQR